MLLAELSDGDKLYRYKKALVLLLAGKRIVLSTGPNNGGYREDLTAVFNHDANPGEGMPCEMRADTYEEHMNIVAAEDLGLDAAHCSGLCTAASMQNVSVKQLACEELTVTAIVTGGIERNAGRAGDPATFTEKNGQFYTIKPGTINCILHISCNLDPGTLVRCLITATEAKTVAIQELMAPSCYSEGIASGSGTDGTIIVCNPGADITLTNAGKNSRLGELIGKIVKEAVKEALYRQSGLCQKSQHDILKRMGRFGVTEDTLWQLYIRTECAASMNRAEFTDCLYQIRQKPELVTWTSVYAHMLDQIEWGLLTGEEAKPACQEILKQMTGGLLEIHLDSTEKRSLKKEMRQQYMDVCLYLIRQQKNM